MSSLNRPLKLALPLIPLVLVLAFICVIAIDLLNPLEATDYKLGEYDPGGIAFCVGMSSKSSGSGKETTTENQRSYLLMTKGELVTIRATKKGFQADETLESSKAGFWIYVAILVVLLGLTIRFSIPVLCSGLKRKKKAKSK